MEQVPGTRRGLLSLILSVVCRVVTSTSEEAHPQGSVLLGVGNLVGE